jgi:uncharacterized cysteine cluster protein YcgN (CxxCxxCC family)
MNFWEKPLEALSRAEWESLCDGCGKCCLHKLEDADTGEIHATNVACKLLDTHSARCTNYRGRRAFVPDCIRLTAGTVDRFQWLPTTCAYRLRAEGKPLFDWHPLVSGDPESVHRAGQSVRGWTVNEGEVRDLELHVVDREL